MFQQTKKIYQKLSNKTSTLALEKQNHAGQDHYTTLRVKAKNINIFQKLKKYVSIKYLNL